MKILNRLLILLLTSFLFLMSVGAEEPIDNGEKQTTTFNAENVAEDTTEILEDGTITTVEENNNKTSEGIENSETAGEGENTTVEAPTQASNPSTKDEASDISENGELAEVQQQPELGNFTYELIYNEDHTIATVIMEYSGECSELTLNNEDIITEVVNIGVYRVNMEYGDWINTMAFDILVNGMFSFKINVWNGEELLETEEISGSITGLNNDALLFEPNQEPVTYEITSSDVGSSDFRNMTLSYETNVSFTWSIPTELSMADIEDDLTVTVNNSNLAAETALRIRVASTNDYKLIDSVSGESLTYIITDQSSNLIKNDDVILDHLYNQASSSNTLHFDLTQMPVLSGKYEDTLCFTASIERLLDDLYSGRLVTINQLGTTHNLINTKIYGVSKQDGTPTPDSPVEIQSVVNPSVKVTGKNLCLAKDVYKGASSFSEITLDGRESVRFTSGSTIQNKPIAFKENTQYTVSFDLKMTEKNPDGEKEIVFTFFYTDGTKGSTIAHKNDYTDWKRVIMISQEGKTIESVGVYVQDYGTWCNVSNFQLEEGLVATEYELHKEQSTALPYTLNAIPVSSGGNVTVNGQQYIADYVDIENKQLVKMTEKIDIGTLDYNYDSNFKRFYSGDLSKKINTLGLREHKEILCENLLNDLSPIINSNKDNTIAVYENGGIYIHCYSYTDSIEFANAMSGKYLYYPLATPAITDLTDVEVQAFKDLYTYSPTTVVSASSEQLTPYIEFGLS